MGMFEVAEPAAQQWIEVSYGAGEAVAPCAPRLLSYAVLELVQALLAHVTLAGFETVAEELEPLPRLPTVADMRLFGVQREAVFAHPGAHLREGGVRLLARPAQDDEVVRIPHHAAPAFGHRRIQRVEVEVGQQRADHRALRRALCRRPPLQPFQDVGLQPAADQIENPAIADLLLDPRHQPIMRDRIEIGGQVRVYDVGVAILDQPIDFPQRVMASASRSEAVAPIAEPRFENRFDHEPDSLLDDAILDRRNAQRPRSSIALGNVDPFDGLRAVGSLPQRRRQLGQIIFGLRREPLDALPIHARRAFVGPDLRPGRRQRLGREHLIHQTEPFAAFDAVAQRRQHAFRPDRGFDPRKVTLSLSALCSLVGTPDGLLPRPVHRASPSCPPSLARVYVAPSSRDPSLPDADHSGSMRALTPARLAHAAQVSPLPLSRHPNIPPPTTLWARASFSQSPQRARRVLDPGFAMDEQARRATPPKRVRYPAGCSFASGCSPPRLATTQLPSATCVTTSHRLDFHPPDKTTSRTHPPRQSRGNSQDISCPGSVRADKSPPRR